jgi:hypothetical protein
MYSPVAWRLLAGDKSIGGTGGDRGQIASLCGAGWRREVHMQALVHNLLIVLFFTAKALRQNSGCGVLATDRLVGVTE